MCLTKTWFCNFVLYQIYSLSHSFEETPSEPLMDARNCDYLILFFFFPALNDTYCSIYPETQKRMLNRQAKL